MANGINITKETFQELDTDAKLNAVFDVLVSVHSQCSCRQIECEKRFKEIEKRKWADRGFTGSMGIIGGFIASFFKGGLP